MLRLPEIVAVVGAAFVVITPVGLSVPFPLLTVPPVKVSAPTWSEKPFRSQVAPGPSSTTAWKLICEEARFLTMAEPLMTSGPESRPGEPPFRSSTPELTVVAPE